MFLQEFIVGEDIGVEALFYNGQLVSYNCSTILSYMTDKFSFTTRRIYYQDADLALQLKNWVKALELVAWEVFSISIIKKEICFT